MLEERDGSPSKVMGAVGLSVKKKKARGTSKTVGDREGATMNTPVESSEWLFGMQMKVIHSVWVREGGRKHIAWGGGGGE